DRRRERKPALPELAEDGTASHPLRNDEWRLRGPAQLRCRSRSMRAAHPEQQQRLYAKLRRQLGAAAVAALGDADVTEGMCNPDGALWVESHAKGMRDLGDRLTESQVESLIGTVAALLGSVVHGRAPIVEG